MLGFKHSQLHGPPTRLLEAGLRDTDFVGRVGGEEFLMVLPVTPLADALRVAEKVRELVGQGPIDPVGIVTISLGVCESSSDFSDAHQIVSRADQLLYRSKASGRNRVSYSTANDTDKGTTQP